MRRYLSLCILLFLVSCGSGTSQIGNHDVVPEPGQHAAANTALPVVMNPQQPVDTPFKGLSWTEVQPLLPELPVPFEKTVSSAGQVSKLASAYEASLPSNRVASTAPPEATYSPNWHAGSSGLEDTAYAMYRFDLSALETMPASTVGLGWATPPQRLNYVFVGLGNATIGRWDWYQLDNDGIITLPGIEMYLDGTEQMYLAIVVLGSHECTLNEIRLGAQELRAMGGSNDLPAGMVLPPLYSSDLPGAVDLSPGCSPVSDQGNVPACTAFAIADGAYNYELNAIYHEYGWDFANLFNRTSTRYMYLETGAAQGLGSDEGRSTVGCIDWLAESGDATEQNAPWGDPLAEGWGAMTDWGDEAFMDASLLHIENSTPIDPTGTTGVTNVKTVLAQQHRPLVMQSGIDWDFGTYQAGEVWNFTGPLVGYHVMCIVGYDDSVGASGAFKVRNSWSADWGDAGYAWIGYETFVNASAELYLWCWTIQDDYDLSVAQRFCNQTATLEPPHISASDGVHADRISVQWDTVPLATGYKVYRDSQDNEVADIEETTWDDTSIADDLAHIYWAKAYNNSHESELSTPDTGYVAFMPKISSVSPQSGYPGQRLQFSAAVSGSTPITFAWDFGGGAVPNTSVETNPEVVLGAAGNYEASLTITNSHGSDTFNFTLTLTLPTYTASGVVVNKQGIGLPGVTMSVSGGSQPVQTDATGHWSRSGLTSGPYTVTPSISGYFCNPAQRSFLVEFSDLEVGSFTASRLSDELVTIPATAGPSNDCFQIFFKEPITRRNGKMVLGIDGFVIQDNDAYNDILKTNGHEFPLTTTEAAPRVESWPKIGLKEVSQPSLNGNEVISYYGAPDAQPGLISANIMEYAKDRIVIDCASLTPIPGPNDPVKFYVYKLFKSDGDAVGWGNLTVDPETSNSGLPTAIDWGVNVWNRQSATYSASLFSSASKSLNGSNVKTLMPDVLWFAFNDGWYYDAQQNATGVNPSNQNVRMKATDNSDSRYMIMEIRLVYCTLNADGTVVAIHVPTATDFRNATDPHWPGVFQPSHTYALEITDALLPGSIPGGAFGGTLTITGTNPNE
jgi:PKD repeat protein